jgi:hypothetical protein
MTAKCLGWLAVFVDPKWCLVFIGAGLLFHLATAFTMGLNSFFWSFVSTFPTGNVLSEAIARLGAKGDMLTVMAGSVVNGS